MSLLHSAFSFKIANIFLSVNYNSKARLGRISSVVVILLVFILHLLALAAMLNHRSEKNIHLQEPVLILQLLQPEPPKSLGAMQLLTQFTSSAPKAIYVQLPEFTIIDSDDYINKAEEKPYELPNRKSRSEEFSNVFDPKLREKLQSLRIVTPVAKKNQRISAGVYLDDMGGGTCILTDVFAKTSVKIQCGPTESEQMMLNVEADLAERNKAKR